MMAQDEEEGEEGEDYVDKVIRSLPDDTTNLVSNHLKDVLVGMCVHTHTTTTHSLAHTPSVVLCCYCSHTQCCVVCCYCSHTQCCVVCCYCSHTQCCVVLLLTCHSLPHTEWGQGVTERAAETGATGRQLQHSVEWS